MSARVRTHRHPPDECAVCGADIPLHAKACPECGADERTGWREQSVYDGLDLPEHGEAASASGHRLGRTLPWYWALAGAVTLVALILLAMRLV